MCQNTFCLCSGPINDDWELNKRSSCKLAFKIVLIKKFPSWSYFNDDVSVALRVETVAYFLYVLIAACKQL